MAESVGSSRHYRAVTLTAAGGAFLAMLDSTAVNIAVPSIRHSLPGASVAGVSWVISVYAVIFAAFLAPAGKLSDALGRRRVFVIGVGLFLSASLLCALSPDLPVLVAARVLQGAGAAAMTPASLAILLLDGPADRRTASIGVWSAVSAVGAAIGPGVGGGLVEIFGWRAVFFINLPFGIGCIVFALRLLAHPGPVSRQKMPDPLGTVLLTLGIGALTAGVTEGGNWGWQSPRTVVCLVLGPVAIALALLRSRGRAVPALDTFLWRIRGFAAANVVSLLYGMATYSLILASVLYITSVWHFSELQTGLANTPGALLSSAAALVMGRLSVRLGGPRGATVGGLVLFLCCCLWLAFRVTSHPAFLTFYLPAGIVGGIGMGAVAMGVSACAAMAAPPTLYGSAISLNTTARQFGGALGIAIMAAILVGTGSGQAGIAPFRDVFIFCAILVGAALVVAAGWLRIASPTAHEPAPMTAVPEEVR
jgi:EmrB/QacA subfamily drug resistance transporter